MKRLFAACFVALLAAHGSAANAAFDSAFTVGSAGSTTPVTTFGVDGPAPVLFLDLPGIGGFSTNVTSDWFRGVDPAVQFTLAQSSFTGFGAPPTDKFWLSPAALTWNDKKALGDWHIAASYSLVTLLCIENGGICVPRDAGSGSATVNFSVTSPVPEPSGMMLLGACLVGLASWRTSSRS